MIQKFRLYAFFVLFLPVFAQLAAESTENKEVGKNEEMAEKREATVKLLLKEGLFSWIGARYELDQEYVVLSRMIAANLVFLSHDITTYIASSLVMGGVNGLIVCSGMGLVGMPFNYGISQISGTSYYSKFFRFLTRTSRFVGQSVSGALLSYYCTFK